MSKRGDWPWAPLSSDLEVYDFFLWGYLKHQIWDTPQNQHPRTLRDIRAAIVRECNNLPPAMISNVFDGMVSRTRKYVNARGHTFPDE